MQTSIEVRPARLDDIPGVQLVAQTSWRATYAGQIADADIEQFLASAYSDRSLIGKLHRLTDGFVVALAGGQVVGYAMAGLNRSGAPEVFAIYVLPEHHGTGAGQQLWDAAVAWLAQQGHTRVCCWVLEGNRRAERFYERQGATMVGTGHGQVGATAIREARYCVTICPIGQDASD